jgi:hypothetical protein
MTTAAAAAPVLVGVHEVTMFLLVLGPVWSPGEHRESFWLGRRRA